MLCFGFSVYIQKTSVKQFSHVLVPAKTNKKEREKRIKITNCNFLYFTFSVFSHSLLSMNDHTLSVQVEDEMKNHSHETISPALHQDSEGLN